MTEDDDETQRIVDTLELARKALAFELSEQMLADLAANLMRIARGSGSPERVRHQIFDLAVALTNMKDHEIYAFPGLVRKVLRRDRVTSSDSDPDASRDERKRDSAKQDLLDGALQVVASRILHQLTHEAAGEDQIGRALRVLGGD